MIKQVKIDKANREASFLNPIKKAEMAICYQQIRIMIPKIKNLPET